jgi:hypothetical protein
MVHTKDGSVCSGKIAIIHPAIALIVLDNLANKLYLGMKLGLKDKIQRIGLIKESFWITNLSLLRKRRW